MRTLVFTCLALVAFAANSVLCRIALGQSTIDAATFSTIRLAAGGLTLYLITGLAHHRIPRLKGSFFSATMLFLYAIPFSFAYLQLGTGSGALILFGAVQITMMVAAVWFGERPHSLQWVGLFSAFGGLVYFLSPGVTTPDLFSAALMGLAGISWGVYSLLGRSANVDPLEQTAGNFLRAIPMALCVSLIAIPQFKAQINGVLLAILSGGLASGIGYAIWYQALKKLSRTQAAVAQLSVPIIAAAGGVLFMSEAISVRLVVATVVVLGGIGLAVWGREKRSRKKI